MNDSTTELKKLMKIFNDNDLNVLVVGSVQIQRHQPLRKAPGTATGPVGVDTDSIEAIDKEIESKLLKLEA